MTVHDLLWEMTKKNNFYVKSMKHTWLKGEPWLPSILPSGRVYAQEVTPYEKLLGAKVRVKSTLMPTGVGDSDLVSWYIDYPENKPYLIILLEMANRLHDIHGKSTPIARALTAIDKYENHPD